MKRGLVLLSAVILALPGVALPAVHQCQIDASLSGSWFQENADTGGLDFDGWFVSGGIGYFLTNHLEVEAAGMYIKASGNPTIPFVDKWDEKFYAIGGKAKWHFMPTNIWVPYVGMQIFWGKDHRDAPGTQFDAEFDGWLWGPVAGLRFQLTPHADFFIEYQYHIWEGEISAPPTKTPNSPNWDDGHLVAFGLILKFL